MRKPSIFKYIVFAVFIFLFALSISSGIMLLLKIADVSFANNDDLLASMIEGAVGAIAAGFVLYQLKLEELEGKKDTELREDTFYQHFISYWLEADKVFIEHPECREYFYSTESADDSGKQTDLQDLQRNNPPQYQLVMSIAEYFDDLCRYSEAEIQQQGSRLSRLPADQVVSFLNYIQKMRDSRALRAFRKAHRNMVNSTESDGLSSYNCSTALTALLNHIENAKIPISISFGERLIAPKKFPHGAGSNERIDSAVIDYMLNRYGCITLAIPRRTFADAKAALQHNSLSTDGFECKCESTPPYAPLATHLKITLSKDSQHFLFFIRLCPYYHLKKMWQFLYH